MELEEIRKSLSENGNLDKDLIDELQNIFNNCPFIINIINRIKNIMIGGETIARVKEFITNFHKQMGETQKIVFDSVKVM